MSRGGPRLNAGAKPKWKHGKTKTIRVPEILLNKIMEYAKKLDNEDAIEIVSFSNTVPGNPGTETLVSFSTLNLSNIPIYFSNGRSFVFIEDLVKRGYEIQPPRLAATVLDEMYRSQILKGSKPYGS